MKGQYEDRTRYMLPRRTFTVIRVDGRAFSSFTRDCPAFDPNVLEAMTAGALALAEDAQGGKFGFIQSDEISLVLTDFDRIETEAWFDGNLQKIASVAASLVTAAFNAAYRKPWAVFDARVFTIPDPIEVENYLVWRQKDAIRNSISMLAQEHFSPKQLHGAKQTDMLGMLQARGVEWAAIPVHFQRGVALRRIDGAWQADTSPPVFTDDRAYMSQPLTPKPADS